MRTFKTATPKKNFNKANQIDASTLTFNFENKENLASLSKKQKSLVMSMAEVIKSQIGLYNSLINEGIELPELSERILEDNNEMNKFIDECLAVNSNEIIGHIGATLRLIKTGYHVA